MERVVLKSAWNALAIVGLVLGVWFLVTTGNDSNGPEDDGPSSSKEPILEAVKRVNKLVLVEHYSMIDVEHSQVPSDWLPFIKQEMIVLLRGRVPAGFDLQQLTEDDVWVSSDGKQVHLKLPPPEVFEENVSIDFENSRAIMVSDTCPDFICETPLVQYKDDILPAGRERLIDFAHENGILQQAVDDGRIYYEQFLGSLGFEDVTVEVEGYGL